MPAFVVLFPCWSPSGARFAGRLWGLVIRNNFSIIQNFENSLVMIVVIIIFQDSMRSNLETFCLLLLLGPTSQHISPPHPSRHLILSEPTCKYQSRASGSLCTYRVSNHARIFYLWGLAWQDAACVGAAEHRPTNVAETFCRSALRSGCVFLWLDLSPCQNDDRLGRCRRYFR